MDDAKQAFKKVKSAFGLTITGLQNLEWDAVPEKVKNYIAANPGLTIVQIALLLVTACPGLVVAPVLGCIGFSSIGPVAGSAAAGFQSAHGATWVFSGLQSAAMGGYGAAAVNGIVQGCSVLSAGILPYFRKRTDGPEQSPPTEDADRDKEQPIHQSNQGA